MDTRPLNEASTFAAAPSLAADIVRALYASDSLMMGIVDVPDDDSDIIHVHDSPATHRFFGFAPGTMSGRRATDLGVAPSVIAQWVARYRECQRCGRDVRFEYLHPSAAGPLHLVSTVVCVGRGDGASTRFAYATEDVTARRRAEEHLRDRDMHLRLAMDASLSIAFEWDIVNDRVRRLQSAEPALPATEEATDTLAGVASAVHPDDRAVFDANLRAAMASADGVYRSEFRITRPDGEVRWLAESGRVEFDASHRPLRLIGISQDVTARRMSEAQIRRQARLIDLSHDPIMVWSTDEGIVDWNDGAARLYGYARDEALGRKVDELLATRAPLGDGERPSRVLADGEWTGELRHRARDGREIIVESRQQVVRLEGRTLVLESNRDISERKRVEDALREADRRKDEFIAILAHELRNPLAPVRNAVEILQRRAGDDPLLARAREVIDRQVSHMARLIDDLLDVSRIARGKLALQIVPCDLTDIARQTAEDYRGTLESAGLTLTVLVPAAPVWVDGDPVRLAQMIGNLLNNASRFTPRGGAVTVSTDLVHEGRVAVVRVADTGRGIEPAMLARLFDSFSQAEQDLARTKGGLGLGLALTKGLAEMHGGGVAAQSDGLERGATFEIRLPARRAARVADTPTGIAASPAQGLRILVVEDNEDAAESLAELLRLLGHDVEVALDGASALALVARRPPDVVISDLGLPGAVDGYELARRLRAQPGLGRVRLVALSGYANDDARQRSRLAGFDAHLAKPPDLAQLQNCLLAAPAA